MAGQCDPVPEYMMKRSKLRIAVLVIVVGGAVALSGVVYWWPDDAVVIDESVYERIKLGMTEAEVDEAIGIPAGDHTRAHAYQTSKPICDGGLPIFIDYHPNADGRLSAPHPQTGKPLRGKWWRGKDGQVLIFFGDDGRVIERRFYPGKPLSWMRLHWGRLVR